MSWVPGLDGGRAGEIIARLADPYLDWFARFKFLRSGAFDFSPIAALAVLAVLSDLVTTLASFGLWAITVGLVLSLILGALWSAVAFMISFFAVCAFLRMLAYLLHWNALSPLWLVIDSMLNPMLFTIKRLIYRNRFVNYMQGLVTGLLFLVILRVGGGYLMGLAMRALQSLPF